MVETPRSRFLDAIKQELSDGLGFVPFLGAGISAPSGIPVTSQLTPYLKDCVDAAVDNRWNPRHGVWPMFGDWQHEPGSRATLPPRKQLEALLARPGSIAELDLAALGANTEWLAQLQFLSRFTANGQSPPELLRIERDVLDAFVRRFCDERRPSLVHRMLARMRRMLRIRLLLTTNFDDLIESAFEEIDTPYEVYDVPDAGKLPPSALVLNEVASIVKLHGGRYAYRADYSLLDSPSLDDRRRLLSYLTGRLTTVEDFERTIVDSSYDAANFRSRRQLDIPRHLLVIGLGGRDSRIISLFQSALRFSDHAKIFWLCRHERERERIEGALTANLDEAQKARIYFDSAPHAGLFLAELFQHLSHSLPPPLPFPVAWRLPVPPRPEPSVRVAATAETLVEATQVYRHAIAHRSLPVYFELSDLRRSPHDDRPLTHFRSKLYLAIISNSSEDPNAAIPSNDRILSRMLRERMAWNRSWRIIIDWSGCDEHDLGALEAQVDFVEHVFDALEILPSPDAYVSTEVVHVTSERDSTKRSLSAAVKARADERGHKTYVVVETGRAESQSAPFGGVDAGSQSRWAELFRLALLLQRRARIPRYNIVSTLVSYDEHQFDLTDRDLKDVELQHTEQMQSLVVSKMVDGGAARFKPGGFLWMEKPARRRWLHAAIKRIEAKEPGLLAEVRERVADFYEKTFFALRESVAFFESIEHRLFEENVDTAQIVPALIRPARDLERGARQALALARIARADLVRIGLIPESSRRLRQLESLALETLSAHWPPDTPLARFLVPLGQLILELRRVRFDLSSEVGRLPSSESDEVRPASTAVAVWERLRQAKWPQPEEAAELGDHDVEARFREWLVRDCARHFSVAQPVAAHLYFGVCELPSADQFSGAHLLEIDNPWASFVVQPGLRPQDETFVLEPINQSIHLARAWAEQHGQSEKKVGLAIRVLVRLLFRAILFSDQIRLRTRFPQAYEQGEPVEARLKRPLLVAMHIYHFAYELTRHISLDTDFLLRYRARLRTLVAIACFELGRRSEAERRIGEAAAQLSASDGRETPLWRAASLIVEAGGAISKARRPFGRRDERSVPTARALLRRWVRQSTRLSDTERMSWGLDKDAFRQDDFHRSVLASASDAEAALTEAERCLKDARRNTWWRARLLCIRIKAVEYRTTAFALQVLATDDVDLNAFGRDGIPCWGTGAAPAFAPCPVSRTFRQLMVLVMDDSFHLVRATVSYLTVAGAIDAVRVRFEKARDRLDRPDSRDKAAAQRLDGLLRLCDQRLHQIEADVQIVAQRLQDVLDAPEQPLCSEHREVMSWICEQIEVFGQELDSRGTAPAAVATE